MKYNVTLIIRNCVTIEADTPDEAEDKAFELLDNPCYWMPPYDEIITEPTPDSSMQIDPFDDYMK